MISNALRASFIAEMTSLRENIDTTRIHYEADENLENLKDSFSEKITTQIANDFEETLIYEIAYYRSLNNALGITDEMSIKSMTTTYVLKYYQNNPEDFINEIYYVGEDLGSGKTKTYIYDAKTDVAYKIVSTKIGKNTVHSLEYLRYLETGKEDYKINLPDSIKEEGTYASITTKVSTEEGIIDKTLSYYTPNYKNFTLQNTFVVYFDKSDLTDINKVILEPIEDAIEREKTIVNEETGEAKEYVSYDYQNQIWANIVTKNKGKEAWWVWIPRFNYTIDSTNKTTDITFVTTSETASPSFTVDGKELQGIWVSKYEPSQVLNTETNMLPYYLPDIKGFAQDKTYIEIYDKESGTFPQNEQTEIRLDNIKQPLRDFCNENLWFNYDEQIWANIKVVNDYGDEDPSNDNESWWVWIPRYAYMITGSQTDIKFIDVYNNPVDGTELGAYTVHPAFTIEEKDKNGNTIKTELKGIWVSKYEPILGTDQLIEQMVNKPDMKGFNIDTTEIEIYSSDGNTLKKSIKLKDVLTSESTTEEITETEDGVKRTVTVLKTGGIDEAKLKQKIGNEEDIWYDYNKQIWANIKVVNDNGDEDSSNDTESWWVWIPRYAYSIIGNRTEIIFIDKNNKPITEGLELPGDYIPSPAFTIEEKDESGNIKKTELDGIWVSKYEPTGTASSLPEIPEPVDEEDDGEGGE